MKFTKKIWIIGGSTGIGLELVKLCLFNNYIVIVSSRNASQTKDLKKLKQRFETHLTIIDLDVSLQKEIKEKTEQAWNSHNGIDIWFYNAGAYDVMSIDSWDIDKFEQMNEVNYLGVVRLMVELFPYFKTQKKGHWVWNSSLSSYFGLPQGGAYSAPKAALVNLAESIHSELSLNNINIQIINHGFVKTRLTDKNKFEMPQLMEPKFTAEKIFKELQNSTLFEIRFPFILSSFLRLLKILPYRFSLQITKRMLP